MGADVYSPMNYAPVPERTPGMLMGADDADRDMMARASGMQALQQQLLSNRQRGLESDRYGQSTPYELDKLSYEAAMARARNNPTVIGSNIEGEVGGNQTKAAQGQFDRDTVQGKIQQTQSEQALQTYANGLRGLSAQLAGGDTLGAQVGYQQMVRSMPPELQRTMGPYATAESLNAAQDQLSRTLAVRAEERKALELRKSNENIHIGNNAATVQAAQIAADSRTAIANARLQLFMQSNKQNFQQFLTEYARKKALGQATPQDDQMAQMIEQMNYQSRAAGSAGSIDPNAGMGLVFPQIGPRPPQPSAIPGAAPKPGTRENPIRLP